MTEDTKAPSETVMSEGPAADAPEPKGSNSKAIWMGTAVGIGSAAIVAALLYTKRRKS